MKAFQSHSRPRYEEGKKSPSYTTLTDCFLHRQRRPLRAPFLIQPDVAHLWRRDIPPLRHNSLKETRNASIWQPNWNWRPSAWQAAKSRAVTRTRGRCVSHTCKPATWWTGLIRATQHDSLMMGSHELWTRSIYFIKGNYDWKTLHFHWIILQKVPTGSYYSDGGNYELRRITQCKVP